ncbi:MAG: DUF5117 domain-containing protein, partial [Planctomycetes bacterium]|nr:DUF5117 domain-containing protein [Planctomycetota bacterium]
MNRGTFLLAVCCLAGATILCAAAAAQKGDETRISPPAAPQPAPVKDKDKDAEAAKPAPDFPPFEKVLAGFTGPYVGLYSIYQDKKKNLIYAVIPAAQLNRPFLLATSFAGGTTYAGWQWNDYLLYFKRMGKQLVLMEKNVRYRPGSSSAEVKEVVERTYTDSVFLTVPIRAEGGGGCVIDLGTVLAASAARFFGALGRGDASLAEFDFKAFKFNVELGVTMPGQRGQFVKLHYSLADVNALSSPGYPPRLADDRVGYFLTAVKDFSNTKDPDRFVRYINRWNLEKRDPKLALSPPKRPIVIYIEKTVPVQYRRYVREGIELWNQAFEKCGFINAIEVRQQEAFNEFADLDPEDMRFNFFRWITSDQAFAMGPSRANPMTGEIIDADIIMDDSMVQAYLREYEEMVREVSAMTDEQKAYYRAHPARHPDRVILGELALRNAAGACPCGHEDASGLPNGATSGTPAPAAAAHDFMNGFRQCNIGRGKTRELALASLFFWMLDDEEEDKDKKDKKKTAAADRKGDQGDQGDGKAEDK